MRSRSTTTRAGADGRARRARERPLVWADALDLDIGPSDLCPPSWWPTSPTTSRRRSWSSRSSTPRRRHWCVMVQQVADRSSRGREPRRTALSFSCSSAHEDGLSLGSADGLSSASAGRLRTRRVRTHGCGDTDRDGQTGRRGCLRASPEDTGQLGFRLGPRSASRAEEALTASVARPECAPRSSSRRSSSNSPNTFDEEGEGLRQDQPRARGRADPRRRQARGAHAAPAVYIHDDVALEPADALTVDGYAEDTIVRSA